MSETKQESTKFNDEEMQIVKDIQQRYVDVQHKLGQLSVTRIRVEQQIEALNDREDDLSVQFIKTQEDERNFIKEVTKKYGDGILDPKTGVYNKSLES